jgi:hypothetical protein
MNGVPSASADADAGDIEFRGGIGRWFGASQTGQGESRGGNRGTFEKITPRESSCIHERSAERFIISWLAREDASVRIRTAEVLLKDGPSRFTN